MKDFFEVLWHNIKQGISDFFDKLIFMVEIWVWEEWLIIGFFLLIAFLIGFGIGKL